MFPVNIRWPNMRTYVFQYVRKFGIFQCVKPIQNTRVGWHTTELSTRSMKKLYADFVGAHTNKKRVNVAILLVLDSFCKFVNSCPVRKFAALVLNNCFHTSYFPAYPAPNTIIKDIDNVFRSKQVKDLCFAGWWSTFLLHPTIPSVRSWSVLFGTSK